MAEIYTHAFNGNTAANLAYQPRGTNWPVVYILDNEEEAYVGETLDASVRAGQHWQNKERQRLTEINLITEYNYHKSVILDLEAYLIKHMSVDGHFKLQNGNMGLQAHNYYQRELFLKSFPGIWDELLKRKLADHRLKDIENSDRFKYSPYTSLSADQYSTAVSLVADLEKAISGKQALTSVVHGGPGTGKTVLAVFLMKLFADRDNGRLTFSELNSETASGEEAEEEKAQQERLMEALLAIPSSFKVGFVVPMQSLRQTLKGVFKHIDCLSDSMIVSPMEVPKGEKYDLLIVDEAHRLRQRKALSQYPAFDKNNKMLGFGDEGTELDWILACSKYQIFFYDGLQSVKPADVDKARFAQLKDTTIVHEHELKTQFRCLAGNQYIGYIRSIFSDEPPELQAVFPGYDLHLYENAAVMTDAIRQKDTEMGLCRNVAGYAWKWASKSDSNCYDIELDGKFFRWNSTDKDWINSPNSVNEIGCIHTIQGYDLNYAGVIIGPELDYDPVKKRFVVYKERYQDSLGKGVGKDLEALKAYILNIYSTMLTRGIAGTYVYACNKNLREYLKKYIPVENG